MRRKSSLAKFFYYQLNIDGDICFFGDIRYREQALFLNRSRVADGL